MEENMNNINENAVAVIGIACRFPGANNSDEFWNNLKNGVEAISFFSEEEVIKSGVSEQIAKDPTLIKAFGVLDNSDKFDAEFFGLSPREAELIDPQSRLFLECAYEALEDSAYDSERVEGRVGVYASASISSYLIKNLLSNKDKLISIGGLSAQLGNDKDHVPTRVSYTLNLKGPSIAIGTACSSSLVAVHLACQGLLDYHCDMALAGGVTVHANQMEGHIYSDEGIASPDGHCRTFDSRSSGTVFGNGVGIVVLKRYEDAIKDKDNIYAIVLSSAVNNDGAARVSYNAPGIDGQSEVISEAHNLAEIELETISYIEAHGTATKLGDMIEIEALKKAFRNSDIIKPFCALGAVKSNVGHLDSAAGIAGFIKTVLALKNKQIPPSLHYEQQNPSININKSPFYINNKLVEWETLGTPRRAGVSSFAMGGTNAHVILQEAISDPINEHDNKPYIVPISAKTENALNLYKKSLLEEITKSNRTIAEIAYTLQMGRKALKYRDAIVVNNTEQLISKLGSHKTNKKYNAITERSNGIVFMFSGLGSHYENMGIDLFNTNEVFRQNLIECSNVFQQITGENLLDVIYPSGTNIVRSNKSTTIDFLKMVRGNVSEEKSVVKLNKTKYTHSAIFSLEYALTKLCYEVGLKPAALIGHSIGEYTALCISGAINLYDALKVVIRRAEILENAPYGEMITVDAVENQISTFLNESLSIAAINDSSTCVIAGAKKDVDKLKESLDMNGIVYRVIKSEKAFHSKLLDDKKSALGEIFNGVSFNKIQIPIVSSMTGKWLSDEGIADSEYWVNQTTKTVRFYEGIKNLFEENYKNFLEIGAGQNLAGFVSKSNPKNDGAKINVQTVMKNIYDSMTDDEYFMKTVAKMWINGSNINWESFYKKNRPSRISLPTYPFEHKSFWIAEKKISLKDEQIKERREVSNVSWKRSYRKDVIHQEDAGTDCWVIFKPKESDITSFTDRLSKTNIDYIVVHLGSENKIEPQKKYEINITKKNCFDLLFKELYKTKDVYKNFVYIPIPGLEGEIILNKNQVLITELLRNLLMLNDNITLSFILKNAFNIIGYEEISNSASGLFGLINSISSEYTKLNTYCFEYDKNNIKLDEYYSNIISSVLYKTNETVSAYRGKFKWIIFNDDIQYNSLSKEVSKNETILVLGDNKLKKSLVEELSKNKNQRILIGDENENNSQFESLIEMLENRLENKLAIDDKTNSFGMQEEVDKLCGLLAINFITKYFGLLNGDTITISELNAKILSKHKRFLDYLLKIASEDKYLIIEGNKVVVLDGLVDELKLIDLIERIKNEYHQMAGIVEILEYSFSKYADVFSGKMENIDVYNSDEVEIFNENFNNSPLRFGKQKVYINLAKELLKEVIEINKDKKINILEVGAGSGRLTSYLLNDLSNYNIDYTFTDIGKSFLTDAKRLSELLNIEFMNCKKFDISKDPFIQGFEKAKYDIILVYDVLHATENIVDTLKNLELITAPGGIMINIEAVNPTRWSNMSWGFQPGWWSFNDSRNESMNPLLTLDQWSEALSSFDFSYKETFPKEAERRNSCDFGLIVTQKKGTNLEQKLGNIQELDNLKDVQKKNNRDDSYVQIDLSNKNALIKQFVDIKEKYGKLDSIYLCERNYTNMPIVMRDYEYVNDSIDYEINKFEILINSIKESGVLKNKLNVLFEKTKSRLFADESIIGEYVNAFANQLDFDISTMFCYIEDLNRVNINRIIDILDSVSRTKLYYEDIVNDKNNYACTTEDKEHNSYIRPNISDILVKPENIVEEKLAKIWEMMFGINEVGINDSFFELGGDSLMATKIINRIKQQFNIIIKLKDFFENPTIKGVSEKIENILNKEQSSDTSKNSDREIGEI